MSKDLLIFQLSVEATAIAIKNNVDPIEYLREVQPIILKTASDINEQHNRMLDLLHTSNVDPRKLDKKYKWPNINIDE